MSRRGQDLAFGTGLMGVLKTMLQQKSAVEEVLECEGFKGRWAECLKARTEELATERAMSQLEGAELVGEEEAEEEEQAGLVSVSRPALARSSASCPPNSKEYWDAFAAEQVRQYVRLVTEPTTSGALANIIQQSALNLDVKGAPGQQTVLIILEPDNLSETAIRPWERKPALDQGVINKLIVGALQARGGLKHEAAGAADGEAAVAKIVAPGDQDLLIITDGGREHTKNILRGA
jgi:hypothetical protein